MLQCETTRRKLVGNQLQENTLDQVLYTNYALINGFELISPLGKSDHVCINLELGINCHNDSEGGNTNIDKKCWSKFSPEEINCISRDINWDYSSKTLNSCEMWEELHGKLMLISGHVPVQQPNTTDNMPWSNSSLKRSRKLKDKSWSVFDVNPTSINLSIALEKQANYEKKETISKTKYERKISSNLKRNQKSFFSYLRSRKILKTTVGNLLKDDGTLTSNNKESADVLAEAFGSVFVKEPEGPLQKGVLPDELDADNFINDIDISFEEVRVALQSIDIYKSMGPDNQHPKLLKVLSDNPKFVEAVLNLFKQCALSGVLPDAWKQANVVAIYKNGSKKNPLNYRPVSLTCILCKVFEKLFRNHIMEFVKDKIIPQQHGFVNSKSCFSNMLETIESIFQILGEASAVDIFYFDFAKAFDRVPHYRLLSKLEMYGIRGKTLDVIRNFLSNRTMRVVTGNESSRYINVTSGVPQGSVLGPLLFLLYINDLPNGLNSIVKLFADDLKLIGNAKFPNLIEQDLRLLEDWENQWLLRFNPTKCKVMHIDFNRKPSSYNDYFLNGVVLDTISTEKDLGIIFDKSLKWDKNINSAISKANKMIAWVARNFITREKSVMMNIYKALIRPHLEYCVQIWSPAAQHGNWGLILEIEQVQRRFTRMIDGIGTLPYSQRLEALNLTTLAERRIRGDIIETFKIVNNLVDYGQMSYMVSQSSLNLVNRSL